MEDEFHAALITPVIHYTMGGIEGDAKARVISENSKVIPGLYVAGEAFGGVHGANRLGWFVVFPLLPVQSLFLLVT
jgi:succinate dehydrogenase/fumarate reductase flavoprotein subunit